MNRIAENRKWLYLAVLVTACIPLSLGYLMDSGQITAWAESVTGLAESFPGMAFWPETGGIDSNLYLFLPAAVYRLCGSIVLAHIVTLGGLQLLAAAGMYLLARTIHREPLAVLLCVTLYLMAPYRLMLCYEQADPVLSAVWSLVPWYFYGLIGLEKDRKDRVHRSAVWRFGLTGAVALALVGYGSSVMLVILLGLTLLYGAAVFWMSGRPGDPDRLPASYDPTASGTVGASGDDPGNPLLRDRAAGAAVLFLPAVAGILLWLPQGIRFFGYLFTAAHDGLGLPLQSIAPRGYAVSDFMTFWVFRDGKPGLGPGILLAVAALFWTGLAAGKKTAPRIRIFLIAALLCLLCALRSGFWDYAERLGRWALKLVSLMETPGIFVGFASLFLSLACPACAEPLLEEKESLPARGSLVLIWIAAVAGAIFLCNTLAYYTMPI